MKNQSSQKGEVKGIIFIIIVFCLLVGIILFFNSDKFNFNQEQSNLIDDLSEPGLQTIGVEVIEIDEVNKTLSLIADNWEDEVNEGEEQADTKVVTLSFSDEIELWEKNIILDEETMENVLEENDKEITFEDIELEDFLVINFEEIADEKMEGVKKITKMFYEIETNLEELEETIYFEGEISAIDSDKKIIEYLYHYVESEDSEVEFEDKEKVKLSNDSKIYKISDINDLQSDSQEVNFTDLKVGQYVYIKVDTSELENPQEYYGTDKVVILE